MATNCNHCGKKLSFIHFNCRCLGVFCTICRYPEVHKCDYDYKGDGKKKIKAENPAVKGEKIAKI